MTARKRKPEIWWVTEFNGVLNSGTARLFKYMTQNALREQLGTNRYSWADLARMGHRAVQVEVRRKAVLVTPAARRRKP